MIKYLIEKLKALRQLFVSSSVCEHKETTYVNINKAGRYKICIKCKKMLAN